MNRYMRTGPTAAALLLVLAVPVAAWAQPPLTTVFEIGDSTVRNGSGNGGNGQWG